MTALYNLHSGQLLEQLH